MTEHRVICLVIDGLRADMLGPYGNTWVGTPGFNQLAAQSVVVDQFILDSADPAELYRSLWTGSHRLTRLRCGASHGESLASLAKAAGMSPLLVTDDPAIATHALATDFAQRILRLNVASELAEEAAATHWANFFADAIEAIAESPQSHLAWLHTAALGMTWDAPFDYRARLADEEDPEPPQVVSPPSYATTSDVDPDELLGWTQSYAGQVILLDELLASFLAALRELPGWRNAALVLLGGRGFPLGEHCRVGSFDPLAYSVLFHVPCLLQMPGERNFAQRSSALVQPPDLFRTIATLLGLPSKANLAPFPGLLPLLHASANEAARRDRAIFVMSAKELALRTPAWQLRNFETDGEEQRELYVKPDDRYEISNVAGKMPLVTEAMAEWLAAARTAGNLDWESPLPELLTHGV